MSWWSANRRRAHALLNKVNIYDLDTENLTHVSAISLRRFFGSNNRILQVQRLSDGSFGSLWIKNGENYVTENSIVSPTMSYNDGVALSTWHQGGDVEVVQLFQQTSTPITESSRLMYLIGAGQPKLVVAGVLQKQNGMPTMIMPGTCCFLSNGHKWSNGSANTDGTALAISSSFTSAGASVVLSTGQVNNNRLILVNDRRSNALNAAIVDPTFNNCNYQYTKDNGNLKLQIITKQGTSVEVNKPMAAWADNDAPTTNTYTGSGYTNSYLQVGGQGGSVPSYLNGNFTEVQLFSGHAIQDDIDSIKSKINAAFNLY